MQMKETKGKNTWVVAIDNTARLTKMASALAVDDFITLYEPICLILCVTTVSNFNLSRYLIATCIVMYTNLLKAVTTTA